jgi:hypothetical protein
MAASAGRGATAGERGTKEVLRVAQEFADALGAEPAASADQLKHLLSADFVRVDNNVVATGREEGLRAIASYLERQRTFLAELRFELTVLSTRVFDDIAVVSGRMDLVGVERGSKTTFKNQLSTDLVLRKRAGWVIVHQMVAGR